ncbi:MAG: serine acetyltransferase [Erysipelotrichaceae bacterium]|jgi:serine O-acetyltransferase|nr:serine acetyltransferase [Erysipelotrichaceae bacterium]
MELKKEELVNLPSVKSVEDFLFEIRNYLFPNYFKKVKNTAKQRNKCRKLLQKIIKDEEKAKIFFNSLNEVSKILSTDIEMTFASDPASESTQEIILTYPGFYAIFVHRIAHELYKLNVKIIPRVIAELAHSKTGIDIHPGAKIGEYFFIDHGTGIVIGETAEIGHHVKIYQGVTLGAISLSAGRAMKGEKRHPTVKNYVTIYSNASILGGETVIGNHVTVGSSVFITKSVNDYTRVINKEPELILEDKDVH